MPSRLMLNTLRTTDIKHKRIATSTNGVYEVVENTEIQNKKDNKTKLKVGAWGQPLTLRSQLPQRVSKLELVVSTVNE